MHDAEYIRFALTDANSRQEALLNLLYQTDQKALGLVSLYFTLSIAMGSVAIAGLSDDNAIPSSLIVGFSISAMIFFLGGLFCFRAMKTQNVGFPGRGPEFWLWAIENEVAFTKAAAEYFKELDKNIRLNRQNNQDSALAMKRAKMCGAVALSAGLATALIIALF